MTAHLHAMTFLCCCLCTALSLNTTIIAFSQNNVGDVKIYINIVNPLDIEVAVNISAPRMSSFIKKQERIPPKNVTVIDIDRDDFEITGTGKSDKGILIASNVSDLIITALSTASGSRDMYFVRNASQLCTEYIVITHCNYGYVCQFTIISNEDNTLIEIIFPRYFAKSILFEGTAYGPGDVMNISLQEAQTFQIQSTADLTGVKIMSTNTKLFSVLSGSSLTPVRNNYGRDYIADMVPPIAAWGSEYILVQRKPEQYLHDLVKFVAADCGANISMIGCGPVLYHQIPEFQIYLFHMTCERIHVISDEPVLIAHFPVGNDHGDPAMFFPTPVNHFVSKYTVYIPPGFINCAVALETETIKTKTFNTSDITDSFIKWEEIEHSAYSTAWLNDLTSGVLELAHYSPFGGHVICKQRKTVIAFTIGPGNLTLNGPQESSRNRTITESSTIQKNPEILINADSVTAYEHTDWHDILSPSYVISSPSNYVTDSTHVTNDVIIQGYITSSATSSTFITLSTTKASDVTMSLNRATNVSTNQTATNVNETMRNCSCCKTQSYFDSYLPSPEMLKKVNELKKTLLIPKNSTSKYIRRLKSAWDKRTSSAVIGAVGVVVLCVVFGSIIAIDIASIYQKRR